jgi:hypothetical protein
MIQHQPSGSWRNSIRPVADDIEAQGFCENQGAGTLASRVRPVFPFPRLKAELQFRCDEPDTRSPPTVKTNLK